MCDHERWLRPYLHVSGPWCGVVLLQCWILSIQHKQMQSHQLLSQRGSPAVRQQFKLHLHWTGRILLQLHGWIYIACEQRHLVRIGAICFKFDIIISLLTIFIFNVTATATMGIITIAVPAGTGLLIVLLLIVIVIRRRRSRSVLPRAPKGSLVSLNQPPLVIMSCHQTLPFHRHHRRQTTYRGMKPGLLLKPDRKARFTET